MLGSVTIASNIAQAQYARGLIALCAGRHATAFGHLWRVFDPRDTAYHPIWGSWTISELAEAAVTAEHRDLARTALAELEVMGHQTPSPTCMWACAMPERCWPTTPTPRACSRPRSTRT
ncbi:hypothetical protein ACFQQB_54440 [Nonomuraea rubra]|uniref:hypothetical protein n=1 Tax=Nonomuraea rubra TaxID=46180 RepID=UPI003608241F